MSSGLHVVYLISLLALGSVCNLFQKLMYILSHIMLIVGLDSCIVNKGENYNKGENKGENYKLCAS